MSILKGGNYLIVTWLGLMVSLNYVGNRVTTLSRLKYQYTHMSAQNDLTSRIRYRALALGYVPLLISLALVSFTFKSYSKNFWKSPAKAGALTNTNITGQLTVSSDRRGGWNRWVFLLNKYTTVIYIIALVSLAILITRRVTIDPSTDNSTKLDSVDEA